MQDLVCELRRKSILGTSVNKAKKKAGCKARPSLEERVALKLREACRRMDDSFGRCVYTTTHFRCGLLLRCLDQ